MFPSRSWGVGVVGVLMLGCQSCWGAATGVPVLESRCWGAGVAGVLMLGCHVGVPWSLGCWYWAAIFGVLWSLGC